MDHKTAVQIWNATAMTAKDGGVQITHLGVAALAAGAHSFAYETLQRDGILRKHNHKIAEFLRDLADGLDWIEKPDETGGRDERETAGC